MHQPQDDAGPFARAFEVRGRREVAGRLQQPRHHRGLGGRHIGCGLAEIALARRLEPAGACAEIAAVHVDVEDVVLGVLRLHRQRVGHFLDLAPQRGLAALGLEIGFGLPLGGVERVAQAQKLRDLLGDGRAAVAFQRAAPLGHVDLDGAGHAARIDAEVGIEPLVLGRDHGVLQHRRDLVGTDGAERLAAPGEHLAVTVQHRDRPALAAVEQRLRFGQGRIIIGGGREQDQREGQPQPPDAAPDDSPHQRDRPGDAARHDVAPPAGLGCGGRCRAAPRLARGQAAAATIAAVTVAAAVATAALHGLARRGRRLVRVTLVGDDAPVAGCVLHACNPATVPRPCRASDTARRPV